MIAEVLLPAALPSIVAGLRSQRRAWAGNRWSAPS